MHLKKLLEKVDNFNVPACESVVIQPRSAQLIVTSAEDVRFWDRDGERLGTLALPGGAVAATIHLSANGSPLGRG